MSGTSSAPVWHSRRGLEPLRSFWSQHDGIAIDYVGLAGRWDAMPANTRPARYTDTPHDAISRGVEADAA